MQGKRGVGNDAFLKKMAGSMKNKNNSKKKSLPIYHYNTKAYKRMASYREYTKWNSELI